MQIRLSGPIERDSIVNGDGLRAVVWTQGCRQHCPGCQNPETWDLEGGLLVEINEVKERLSKLKGQTGLTFCGGEPFLQPKAC
ncbi:4Fe-4S cluster-binding domain-containing protein, partial [Candidatus Saccharibacteria bacterium]|nr:4Fe-4S cluster-binding domain-containing protein [Candidatus Saccharibacteria bacterium]